MTGLPPGTVRELSARMLVHRLLAEITGDAILVTMAVSVAEPDGTVLQYLAKMSDPKVTRLLIPPERFADIEALADTMVNVTPPADAQEAAGDA